MIPVSRLAWLALLAVIAPTAGACVDAGRCEAALAGADRARADALRQEAQVMWLRMQLATFAGDLQARSAADRDMLLRRLAALEAANAAVLARLDHPQAGAVAVPPPPVPPPPAPPPPAPPPPPVAKRAPPPLDTSSPYAPRGASPPRTALPIDEASPY
jgi:hypothetical protein